VVKFFDLRIVFEEDLDFAKVFFNGDCVEFSYHFIYLTFAINIIFDLMEVFIHFAGLATLNNII